jgi:hypothetical protein
MTVGDDSRRPPETGITTANARIDAHVTTAGLGILLSRGNSRVSSHQILSHDGGG